MCIFWKIKSRLRKNICILFASRWCCLIRILLCSLARSGKMSNLVCRYEECLSEARRQRIEEALELVGMEKFADYAAQGLSGGETKRVALARALVLQPDVLLCDEPTANVDNENQEIILNIIERINRERKGSIIFSTHYLSQGTTACRPYTAFARRFSFRHRQRKYFSCKYYRSPGRGFCLSADRTAFSKTSYTYLAQATSMSPSSISIRTVLF